MLWGTSGRRKTSECVSNYLGLKEVPIDFISI